MKSINQTYKYILSEILDKNNKLHYDTVKFQSVDGMIAHPNNGYTSFSLDTSSSFPLITARDIRIKISIAEMLWYLNGSIDQSWLKKYTKIWDNFADEDGFVRSSYGYRWRSHFGRDQIAEALSILQKDFSNRQAVVLTWDPTSDGLDSARKKNVPCVVLFQLTILDNKLNLSVLWRSQDMYLGFPHDITGFALLQSILAQKLGLEVGLLHWTIQHAHLYENQVENAKKLLAVEPDESRVKLILPQNTFDIARDGTEQERDGLLQEIHENLQTQYKPVQKLKHVKIAV